MRNERIHGDSYTCISPLMERIKMTNVKLVLCDPPFQKDKCYNAYERAGKNIGLLAGPVNNYRQLYKQFYDMTLNVKGRVLSFGNCHTYPLLYIAAWDIFHHSKSLIRDKKRGVAGYHFRMSHSLNLFSWHEGDALATHYDTVIQCKNDKKSEKKHPYQLPRKLVEFLINHLTEEGDLVFDPFYGSCIVGDVCRDLGREFIGIEIDPAYALPEKENSPKSSLDALT